VRRCVAAVQQERKPPEPKDIRPTPILGSPAHRIFIRKDDEGLDTPITGFLNKAEVIVAALYIQVFKYIKEFAVCFVEILMALLQCFQFIA